MAGCRRGSLLQPAMTSHQAARVLHRMPVGHVEEDDAVNVRLVVVADAVVVADFLEIHDQPGE